MSVHGAVANNLPHFQQSFSGIAARR